MERTRVVSSSVEAVSHDGDTLHVWFRSGAHYSYAGVSDADARAFLAAPSAGKHFHTHVNGKYEHAKVQEVNPDGSNS